MDHSTDKLWEHDDLKFYDMAGSDTLHWTIQEVIKNDEYGLRCIDFYPGDVVIDIGANVGTTCIWLAKMHPEIQIVAIEPSKYNIENLSRNLKLNNVDNVQILRAAVWDTRTELSMQTNSQNTGATRTYGGSEKVQAIPLEWIFDNYKIFKCRYLKMDCEGAEYRICQSPKFSRQSIENVGIEIHRNFPDSTYDLESAIRVKFDRQARIKTVWG